MRRCDLLRAQNTGYSGPTQSKNATAASRKWCFRAGPVVLPIGEFLPKTAVQEDRDSGAGRSLCVAPSPVHAIPGVLTTASIGGGEAEAHAIDRHSLQSNCRQQGGNAGNRQAV